MEFKRNPIDVLSTKIYCALKKNSEMALHLLEENLKLVGREMPQYTSTLMMSIVEITGEELINRMMRVHPRVLKKHLERFRKQITLHQWWFDKMFLMAQCGTLEQDILEEVTTILYLSKGYSKRSKLYYIRRMGFWKVRIYLLSYKWRSILEQMNCIVNLRKILKLLSDI